MPRVIAIDRRDPDRASIAEAVRVLRGGGLVAFPTETVYGLGACATDDRALGRIFEAKGRPPSHPLIAHVEGEDQARALAASWSERASALARAFWPGPLTLVVDRADRVPRAVSGGGPSIAVRAPSHEVARRLLAALGEAVAAPSANRYRGLSPTTAAHVVKELGDAVDLVLDAGPCDAGIESTVLDVRVSPPVVLRPGALGLALLRTIEPTLVVRTTAVEVGEARVSPGMDETHYAPRAPMFLAPSRAEAIAKADDLVAEGLAVGLVLHAGELGSTASSRGTILRILPGDPAEFGRLLYGTLHDLDDQGVCAIVVQAVPSDEPWLAVADRLRRGSKAR